MKALKSNLFQGDNQYFFKMFRFMKPYAVRYAVSQFIYSSQGFAIPFIIAIFTGNVMAAILANDVDGVMRAGIILAVMMGGFLIAIGAGIYVNFLTIERAVLDMKRALFRAYVRTGIEDASHSGEGIATINTDANTAKEVFQNPLMQFLYNVIIIPASIVVVFVVDWRLGFAILFVGVLSFVF